MPGNDSFTRGTLVPSLGATALCLFGLCLYTYVTEHHALSAVGVRCLTAEYLGGWVNLPGGYGEDFDLEIEVAPERYVFERELERAFRAQERALREAERVQHMEEHVQRELERVQHQLEERVRCQQQASLRVSPLAPVAAPPSPALVLSL